MSKAQKKEMRVETAVKCRICRQESSVDVVALQKRAPFGKLKYAQVYDYVTGYNNVLQSGPQFLCRVCAIDLSVAYDFRKKCVKSEQLYERNPTGAIKEASEEEHIEYEELLELDNAVRVPEHESSFKNEGNFRESDCETSYSNVIKDEWISKTDKDLNLETETMGEVLHKKGIPDKFYCPFCPKIYFSLSTILDHVHYEHDGKKIQCDEPECPFLCEIHYQLDYHKMKIHSENAVKPIQCCYCEKLLGNNKALIQHCSIEHLEKETTCPREACEFKYFLTYELKKHDKQVHRVKRKTTSMFKCPNCESVFKTRTRLSKHQHEIHGIEPQPPKTNPHLKETTLCPQCGKSLKVSSLNVHIQLVHEKFVSGFFVCDLCGNHYSTKISLANHIKYAHTKRKPIKCRHCPEMFPSVGARRYHEIRIHTHNYKHICSICGLKCFSPQNLKDHFSTHTGETNFQCNICDKKFTRRTVLKNHLVTHTDERPFICSICQSTFKTPKYLKSHMKVHEKIKN